MHAGALQLAASLHGAVAFSGAGAKRDDRGRREVRCRLVRWVRSKIRSVVRQQYICLRGATSEGDDTTAAENVLGGGFVGESSR